MEEGSEGTPWQPDDKMMRRLLYHLSNCIALYLVAKTV